MFTTLRNSAGPLLLMLCCPPFVMLLWYTNSSLDGSLLALWQLITEQGLGQTIYQVWQPHFWGSPLAWSLIFIFMLVEFTLMVILPGKKWQGPVTPQGNIPEYKANGLLAFLVTIGLFTAATFGLHLCSPTILYDNLGDIFGALNLFSFIVCALLYVKGRFWPSSTDSGITGNVLFDYYWGTELYPRFFNYHIKKFITCRFGMMSWGILLLSYGAKQAELGTLSNSMFVSIFLQLLYIAKFYCWEHGYLRSLDIMHDRAGFYICWGCMVWVPCVYTSPSMYLVLHPIELSWWWAGLFLSLGSMSIIINYLADRQRLMIRMKEGNCLVWGKKPVTLIAHYHTEEQGPKSSLLLASGWWGIARHFHYVPEIAGAFFWSVPALFTHFSPYFYVCFLTVLLVDRAFRDEQRCAKKYGDDWEKYCQLVPYKIIPYVL